MTDKTYTSHGLEAGQPVAWPWHLTRWERFKLWLKHPLHRPAKVENRTYYVTSVTEGSSFEIGRTPD